MTRDSHVYLRIWKASNVCCMLGPCIPNELHPQKQISDFEVKRGMEIKLDFGAFRRKARCLFGSASGCLLESMLKWKWDTRFRSCCGFVGTCRKEIKLWQSTMNIVYLILRFYPFGKDCGSTSILDKITNTCHNVGPSVPMPWSVLSRVYETLYVGP